MPSGEIQTVMPLRNMRLALSSWAIAFSRFFLLMGMNPEATRACPHTGTRVSSSLSTIRNEPGTAPINAGMSSSEPWFDITMQGWPGVK